MYRTEDTADVTVFSEPAEAAEEAPARRATLIVLAGGEIGRQIELTEDEKILGRSAVATSQISVPSVSRQHAGIALVERDGEEFYEITDLGSRNGTRVNNVSIHAARLNHGDKVHLGEVVLKFVLQDPEDSQFHQDVHRLIHYDQLTGLLTMETFWHRLENAIRQSGAERLTLSMTDLDGLKQVNDTYGHLAGRMVVREMGAMMRAALRAEDFAGLYGGDESVILYAHASIETARDLAETLRRTIEARVFEFEARTFQVTISQGLAEWPRHGVAAKALVAAADAALYAAKASGRNCIRCAGE